MNMIRLVQDEQQEGMSLTKRKEDDNKYKVFKNCLKDKNMSVVISGCRIIKKTNNKDITKYLFHLVTKASKGQLSHTYNRIDGKEISLSKATWPHLVWTHLMSAQEKDLLASIESWWITAEVAEYMSRQDYLPHLMEALEEFDAWRQEMAEIGPSELALG